MVGHVCVFIELDHTRVFMYEFTYQYKSMSQWGWSVPSWVNNSHSDFWLDMCPLSQKMGDSSAAVVAFHLCWLHCINGRWPPEKKFNVRFSINNSKVCVGRKLNSCYLYHCRPQQHIWAIKVTIKLLIGMFKLRYGRFVLKFAFISGLSKSL